MKEAYTTPAMEVVPVSGEDVITTSSSLDENELPLMKDDVLN